MRANVIVLLVGAFCLYWISYQLHERGMLLPVMFVVIAGIIISLLAKKRLSTRRHQTDSVSAPAVPRSPKHATLSPDGAKAMTKIDEALDAIPVDILHRSGSVFYSAEPRSRNRETYTFSD